MEKTDGERAIKLTAFTANLIECLQELESVGDKLFNECISKVDGGHENKIYGKWTEFIYSIIDLVADEIRENLLVTKYREL